MLLVLFSSETYFSVILNYSSTSNNILILSCLSIDSTTIIGICLLYYQFTTFFFCFFVFFFSYLFPFRLELYVYFSVSLLYYLIVSDIYTFLFSSSIDYTSFELPINLRTKTSPFLINLIKF